MTSATRLLCAALLVGATACAEEVEPLSLAAPDRAMFDAQVYPILVRDCGFHACHGSHERFYQVFGPGHGRLRPAEIAFDPITGEPLPQDPNLPATGQAPFDPTTPEELEHSYRRAASMIDPSAPASSVLLRKPLALGEGGVGHEGVDLLGRDVYTTRLDPNYAILEQWALTAQAIATETTVPALP